MKIAYISRSFNKWPPVYFGLFSGRFLWRLNPFSRDSTRSCRRKNLWL